MPLLPSYIQRIIAGCVIAALTCGSASAQSLPVQDNAATPPTVRARLTNDVIEDAVKETLAGDKKGRQATDGAALGSERYRNFSREVSEAKIPDCLHGDALKFQPTFFGGLLAIPFVIAAAARGKCH